MFSSVLIQGQPDSGPTGTFAQADSSQFLPFHLLKLSLLGFDPLFQYHNLLLIYFHRRLLRLDIFVCYFNVFIQHLHVQLQLVGLHLQEVPFRQQLLWLLL